MSATRFTVGFNAKVTPIKPINDEFTLCKCYVMALNKNRNLSFIGEDAANKALPTLFNVPVIGHMYVDDDGNYHMGGHDMALVKKEDGSYEFKSLCVPYGVVPQQEDIHYEEIEEPNGDVHTYLVADVILWTGRYPQLYEAIYDNDTYFGHSMEINVFSKEPLEEDKNYTNILDYTYSALCLLGKSDNPDHHYEPCFPMSRIEPYEFSLEDDKFSELMEQLKSELAYCFDNAGKGGKEMDNIKDPTVQDNNIVEDFTDNGTNEPIVDNVDPVADPANDNFTDNDDNGSNDASQASSNTQFSSTYSEKREAIINILPVIDERDDDGNLTYSVYHWFCDFDDAYVYVEREEWRPGDYEMTKGRFAYVFDENDKKASISGDFELMIVKWLTQDEAKQIDELRGNYEQLVEYKEKRERADLEATYDAAMEEFADLAGNTEFDEIEANKYSYDTVDMLKQACYAVRGKLMIPASQRKNAAEPTVPVGEPARTFSLRERLHEEFGK